MAKINRSKEFFYGKTEMSESTKSPSANNVTNDRIELLKRMVACHADIQTSLSAITFLNEADEHESYSIEQLRRFKCYETTFVVAYGRAFTESDGSKHKLLSFKRVGLKLSPEENRLHSKILDARRRKYAHSDLSAIHTRIDLHDIAFDSEGLGVAHAHIQWDEGLDFIEGFEPDQIMDLLRKIRHQLFLTINVLANELRDHLPIYIRPEKLQDEEQQKFP